MTLTFTLDELPSLPAWREAVRLLQQTSAIPPGVIGPVSDAEDAEEEDGEESAADLSTAQATAFLEGCSDKTKRVIRAMVRNGGEFRLKALAASLNLEVGEMGGVWGGLTKRTRTILRDKKANFIKWKLFYDADDRWEDSEGKMSETTYESFRKALGI